MKTCKKCNVQLKSNAKFCTQCGTAVIFEESIQINKDQNHLKKSPSHIKKLFIGALLVILVFFLAKTFIPAFDDFINSHFESSVLSRLEGKWHDPTGTLLGSEQSIIVFKKKGDAIIGEDDNKSIYIQLLHYSSNNYGGLVVLNGVDAFFEVSYYKDEDKLVFFSTLTKSSWNIRRLK